MTTPTETPARRGLDPEIQALAKLDRIMAELEPNAKIRALTWLLGRYAPGAWTMTLRGDPAEQADPCREGGAR